MIPLILLAILGQLLHIGFGIRKDYQVWQDAPDVSSGFIKPSFWKSWKKKNLVYSIISLCLVVGIVIAQYYTIPILSKGMALGIGFMLDSFIKNNFGLDKLVTK